MKMKFLLFISPLFLCTHSLFSQQEYMEKSKIYHSARIYQNDYKILNVNTLQLINDSTITYKSVGTEELCKLSVRDLRYVSVKQGTRALTYGLIGAGVGLFSVALTNVEYGNNQYMQGYNWAPLYIGMTLGCGVVGAIIGSFDHKWKRLYLKHKELVPVVMLVPCRQNKYSYSIRLLINI